MYLAAYYSHTRVVQLLVGAGADPRLKSTEGRKMALDKALQTGDKELVR